jgi:hypothetical protein
MLQYYPTYRHPATRVRLVDDTDLLFLLSREEDCECGDQVPQQIIQPPHSSTANNFARMAAAIKVRAAS